MDRIWQKDPEHLSNIVNHPHWGLAQESYAAQRA